MRYLFLFVILWVPQCASSASALSQAEVSVPQHAPYAHNPSPQAPPSLFFTPQEVQKAQKPKATRPLIGIILSLEGILFLAPQKWSVWVNGRCVGHYSSERLRLEGRGIFIEKVTESTVSFLISHLGNTSSLRIHLRPNQIFKNGEVKDRLD